MSEPGERSPCDPPSDGFASLLDLPAGHSLLLILSRTMYKATFMPSKDWAQILEILFLPDFFVTSLNCAIMVVHDLKPISQHGHGSQAAKI